MNVSYVVESPSLTFGPFVSDNSWPRWLTGTILSVVAIGISAPYMTQLIAVRYISYSAYSVSLG